MASPDFLKNMQIGPWEQKKEKKFRTFLKKMLSGVFIKTPKALMTVMRETVEAGKMMAAGKIEEVLPSLMDRLKTRHQKNGEHLEKRKQEGRPVSPDREGLSKQKQEAFEKIILIMQSSNTQTT